MSLLADALQPLLVRQLALIRGRIDPASISDIFAAESAAYDIDFSREESEILINFRESDTLVSAFAGDCCRFAFGAFQTISTIPADIMHRDNAAWSMVKLYYSAFYAGHALLRVFGESCSYFDPSLAARLVKIADAQGRERPFAIDGGMYRCALEPGAGAVRCKKASGNSLGDHAIFWKLFGARLKSASEAILTGPLPREDGRAVAGQLDSLIAVMQRRRDCSWLSSVRNELQYRHRYGVWFPARLRARDREALGRIAARWQSDPMAIDLDPRRVDLLGDFVSSCVFIVAICHAMLTRISDRSAAGVHSFAYLGPLSFSRDIRPQTSQARS
jgi:hypothetical protein